MGRDRQQRQKRFDPAHFGLPILLVLSASSIFLFRLDRNVGRGNYSIEEYILQSEVKRKLEHSSLATLQAPPILERSNSSLYNKADGSVNRSNPQSNFSSNLPVLAGLNCAAHGGPSDDIAKEMVYWEDIPSDSRYVSPFKQDEVTTKYITFEPDEGGWNNARMSMETLVVIAIVTGRTLVLPPRQGIWMPTIINGTRSEDNNALFSFSDFFHLERVAAEHAGLEIITMQEFLERESLAGNILDGNGSPSFPPGNETSWDSKDLRDLKYWLRQVMKRPRWEPDRCMLVIPASTDPEDIQTVMHVHSKVKQAGGFPSYDKYISKPNPVDAPVIERLKENWAENSNGDKTLCYYDKDIQNAKVIHFSYDRETLGARMLVHFYAFLFFQDWKRDLWAKRFVRDHIRYVDAIQCAAARIVHALRQRARHRGDIRGNFDSLHVRRSDFGVLTSSTQVDAATIYEISRDELVANSTVYIATDETDQGFFNPLREHYDIVFLDDFKAHLVGVNTNYYGMIDQLVASRGRVFFGCFYSTFTGYINRLRGYHANKDKSPGYADGVIQSWYYAPKSRRDEMRSYYPLYQGYFYREFPNSWRMINEGISEK